MDPEENRDGGTEAKGFGRRHSGWREQCISHLGISTSPLSKNQTQYLKKKNFFGFLAAAGHHPPKSAWAGGSGRAHVNGGPAALGS